MGLPVKAPGSQLLQMIEGQLSCQGKQTTNVQVNIFEDKGLSLEDADETFLQAPPLDSGPDQGSVQENGAGDSGRTESTPPP